jgi:ribosomal protein S12 methylthiotransferase accessory factor
MEPAVSIEDGPSARVEMLASPYGVAAALARGLPIRGMDDFAIWLSRVGSGRPGSGASGEPVMGSGRALADSEHARRVAIIEAAERYSAHDPRGTDYRWASAAQLQGQGLVVDTQRLPRCSAVEYAHPGCPVRPFDPDARIRWVRGVELVSGQPIWVPAVMATYALPDRVPAENFTFRISTGYAIHSDPAQALIGGICEVIERDAVALTWLQRLPLPLISAEAASPVLDYLRGGARRHFMEPWLFDATTDLGVPTVYCLLIAEHDSRVRHVVGCAADRTLVGAAEKALAEALSVRASVRFAEPPDSFADFAAVLDGARYMAGVERAEAFSFLTDRARKRIASARGALSADSGEALRELIGRFGPRGMQVIAVERSTRELREAGLTSVNVVIPDLQPMSLAPLAQFKAHPRLYDAPRAMGYPVCSEKELNPWPQPFA